jgi:hypothetical protein
MYFGERRSKLILRKIEGCKINYVSYLDIACLLIYKVHVTVQYVARAPVRFPAYIWQSRFLFEYLPLEKHGEYYFADFVDTIDCILGRVRSYVNQYGKCTVPFFKKRQYAYKITFSRVNATIFAV